jgi:hypothetical protein
MPGAADAESTCSTSRMFKKLPALWNADAEMSAVKSSRNLDLSLPHH